MNILNNQYLNNGDLVKIPQNTTLYKKDYLLANYISAGIVKISQYPTFGFIFDTFIYRDHTWYEMLIDNECWCADSGHVYSTGA